jgi:two-component system OmpR family response regulator
MRVLLIEDDSKIASFIVKGLKAEGFAVDHAPDGEMGLHLALTEPYDLAVIDIMLPQKDGFEVIAAIRREKINLPVIILSARGTTQDKVKGLQLGSDDYLTKPFAFSELLARIQALLRRSSGASEPTKLEVGDLSMNLITREVVRRGRKIDLQPLGVFPAGIPGAQCRPGRFQNHDHGTCLGLPFRPADQCGGIPDLPSAGKNRQRF